MAVKWAVANGNWNAGATWNDGVVPTIDDDVYLDGHTINLPTTNYTYINAKTISNSTNPHTGFVGGTLTGGYISGNNAYHYVNASLLIDANVLIVGHRHSRLYVIGNVTIINDGKLIDDATAWSRYVYITGNVDADGILIGVSGGKLLQINGNAIFRRQATQTDTDLEVNGMLTLYASNTCNSVNVATLRTYSNSRLLVSVITINGSITYESTNNTMGVRYTTLNIQNPDTFTWKDITEPRSNPFIILTDAEMNNRQQYPPENEVKEGTEYVWGEKIGTYQQPPESVVLKGFRYDNDEKEGTLENQNIVGCVTKEDVREGVELIGLQEVGTLVVPSVDDVREGVVFDNGSVGTLIVEGGGDRLRIANFGYYTDSQSDTYIVDINDSFKPMFATAEESVLLELFPELDLDNIPDKYFDDLFVKYLKYRLIVEYYRGAGINSVFTPSELTTEVVNYQNVRCEYWLNLANIYLNAWDKKYPNSVKKQRILL